MTSVAFTHKGRAWEKWEQDGECSASPGASSNSILGGKVCDGLLMVRSPGTPHALHCYPAGWSHCHLEGINVQTSRTLSGRAKITSLPCCLVEVLLELLCFSSRIWPESKACFG